MFDAVSPCINKRATLRIAPSQQRGGVELRVNIYEAKALLGLETNPVLVFCHCNKPVLERFSLSSDRPE